MTEAEQWIDLLLKRSKELRKAGILSIGYGGCSAVLAPAEREDDGKDDNATPTDSDEPANPWENPASYPTGRVPTLELDGANEMPDIPEFDS